MSNSLELGKKVIKDKIPLISKNPGVYKMLGATGEILYIGKAKNIPNRLKSYVTESYLPIRTERMLSQTHNLETTTTNNESEALLLEANLIKKFKPKFNILLKDDKSFPYILYLIISFQELKGTEVLKINLVNIMDLLQVLWL